MDFMLPWEFPNETNQAVVRASFFWIKIAVDEIGPFTLVALRLTIAAIFAWLYIGFGKIPLPRDARTIGSMAFVGLFNTAIPFTLISWGETRIDSGMAGVLNGTVPLFTIVIAHFFEVEDRFTLQRLRSSGWAMNPRLLEPTPR